MATLNFCAGLQCGHGDDAVENLLGRLVSYRQFTAVLQCGHGDDAVENRQAGQDLAGIAAVLQCGHGDDAVENDQVQADPRPDGPASMRPRR